MGARYWRRCGNSGTSVLRRLFELALGPLALAFCGTSDKDTFAKIQQLQKKFGPEWIHPYLTQRKLPLSRKCTKAASEPI
jgi:hypothetical protein